MFSDMDPLEEDMGVRVENMTVDQIIAYVKAYHAAFGFTVRIDGQPERAIFRSLQRVYGQADAGRIVKWVFYKYRGHYNDEFIGPMAFSKGRKWFTDKMHLEMQAAMKEQKPKSYAPKGLGVRSLIDL